MECNAIWTRVGDSDGYAPDVTDRSPSWADAALARLSALEDNWDDNGAMAPTATAIQSVKGFLWIWGTHPRRPRVWESPDGGVMLEWYAPGASLVIEFDANGDGFAWVTTDRTEVDGSIQEISDDVGETLMKLWADMSERRTHQSRPSDPHRCFNCGKTLDLDDVQRSREFCPERECQVAEAESQYVSA